MANEIDRSSVFWIFTFQRFLFQTLRKTYQVQNTWLFYVSQEATVDSFPLGRLANPNQALLFFLT